MEFTRTYIIEGFLGHFVESVALVSSYFAMTFFFFFFFFFLGGGKFEKNEKGRTFFNFFFLNRKSE